MIDDFLCLQVRQDWGLRGSIGIAGWQNLMRQYLKHDHMHAQGVLPRRTSSDSEQIDDKTADRGTDEQNGDEESGEHSQHL